MANMVSRCLCRLTECHFCLYTTAFTDQIHSEQKNIVSNERQKRSVRGVCVPGRRFAANLNCVIKRYIFSELSPFANLYWTILLIFVSRSFLHSTECFISKHKVFLADYPMVGPKQGAVPHFQSHGHCAAVVVVVITSRQNTLLFPFVQYRS